MEQAIEERYDEPLYDSEDVEQEQFVQKESEHYEQGLVQEQDNDFEEEFVTEESFDSASYYGDEQTHPDDPQDGFVVVDIDESKSEVEEDESRSIGGQLPPFVVDAPEREVALKP